MVVTGLLLDTHALFWALAAPDRLTPAARERIEEPTEALVVSAASAWEIAIKHRSGRWPEAAPFADRLTDHAARLGAAWLTIDAPDALRAGGLAWDHADPFDRMLAAQALGRDLTLVTRDRAFDDLPGLRTLW